MAEVGGHFERLDSEDAELSSKEEINAGEGAGSRVLEAGEAGETARGDAGAVAEVEEFEGFAEDAQFLDAPVVEEGAVGEIQKADLLQLY